MNILEYENCGGNNV